MSKKLCIIPARGGSLRIPRKNIKNFLGKPIIAYSIEAAINSGLFEEVMVSTDDEEIAEIAIKYGAKVPFLRSEKNSDDYASTMDVIEEVIKNYIQINNTHFQFVCCIYPTAPLIKVDDLKSGYDKLKVHNYTCVFPSVKFSYPIWRSFEIEQTGNTKMFWPEHVNARSQDLKKAYHDAGQWYWFNIDKINKWNWPENSGTVILKEDVVQDIDTLSDWKIAEMKCQLMLGNTK